MTWSGVARRAIRFELAMWRSLFRWITRRPVVPGGDAAAFGYSAAKAPVIWIFIALNAIEIPAVHLLLPWPTARHIVDLLGAYGLIWMLGVLASVYVHPHVVDTSGLRIRSGLSVDVLIPWDAVATVRARTRSLSSSRAVQVDDHVLSVVALSQTNVDVVLRGPTTLPVPKFGEPVTEVRLYADDAAALVARAGRHLTAGQDAQA
jgi:hypothetical protein